MALGFSNSTLIKFIVDAGIITLGIGYLCNALFTFWMLSCRKSRLYDFSKLILAFGLVRKKELCEEQLQKLEDELMDEFHLRLHSHAPQTLIDFCSRRNTGWYISKTSALASIGGWIAACFMIYIYSSACHPSSEIVGVVASFVIFFVVIPCVLSKLGTIWNREFWGVCWKWIHWDLKSQSDWPPIDWVKSLPDGVEPISAKGCLEK